MVPFKIDCLRCHRPTVQPGLSSGYEGSVNHIHGSGTAIVPRADSTHTPAAQMLHFMVSTFFWSSVLIRVCLLFHVT